MLSYLRDKYYNWKLYTACLHILNDLMHMRRISQDEYKNFKGILDTAYQFSKNKKAK